MEGEGMNKWNKRKYRWKVKGWMNGWMKGSIGVRWKNEWKAVYVKGKGWMNGLKKGRMIERINERINECKDILIKRWIT